MKKYIYAIPSLIMAMYFSFMLVYLFSGFNMSNNNILLVSIVVLIPFIIYLYQIIRCVKDAIKDKMYLWIIPIIFIGFIFIPYYGVKYEQDRIVLRNSIITYAVAFIFLSCISVLYAFTLVGKYDYLLLTTKDKKVEFKFSKEWKEKSTEYSIYASNDDKNLAYGVLVYELLEDDTLTQDEIMNNQAGFLASKTGAELELYKDNSEEKLDDKTITTKEFITKLEKDNKIYKLATITFGNDNNYIILTFAALFENDYNNYNEEIININRSARKK